MRAWLILSIAALPVACTKDDGGDASTSDAVGSSGGPTTEAGDGSTSTPPMGTSTDPMADSSDDGGMSSGDSSGGGTSSGSDGSGTGSGALSFETDIWPVLTMSRDPPLTDANDSCSGPMGCHVTGAGGLAMPDVATAYTNLIDQPSSSVLCAGMAQVVPSEPDSSCFVVFYEDRLRDQLGWVDATETDLVRAWVEQGAAP